MYYSNRDPRIIQNPRKTIGKNVEKFIKEKCSFYYGASSIPTEEIFNKYKRYCIDNNLDYSNFSVFAKSFRYFVIHQSIIPGIGIHPINYQIYKEGYGYVTKQGWGYINIIVNY